MSHNKKIEHRIHIYKVLARVVGLITVMFFGLFIVGEGIPDIIEGKGEGLLAFLPVILVPVIGYFLAWFSEWPGTLMICAGALALLIYFIVVKNDIKMALVYSLPFALTGTLFLIHLYKRKKLQKALK